jgi:hypothetical protein
MPYCEPVINAIIESSHTVGDSNRAYITYNSIWIYPAQCWERDPSLLLAHYGYGI